jgi:hypothetical protein
MSKNEIENKKSIKKYSKEKITIKGIEIKFEKINKLNDGQFVLKG